MLESAVPPKTEGPSRLLKRAKKISVPAAAPEGATMGGICGIAEAMS